MQVITGYMIFDSKEKPICVKYVLQNGYAYASFFTIKHIDLMNVCLN
jgi:hypothetical protein